MSIIHMPTYGVKPLGIYIHIPFCLSKCAYCDFNSSVPQSNEIMESYVNALIKHMESYKQSCYPYAPDTVFIGGGTPTVLPDELLIKLIKAIKHNFRLVKDCEFTIEANPATVTLETLKKLNRLGVNRISFGLQSADDNELKALSRRHDRKGFIQSFKMAREAGFNNINVDLMFSIPYQTLQSLEKTIRFVAHMNPEHISLYDLKIEPNTKFYQNYNQIAPFLPDEDTEVEMYLQSVDLLGYLGYHQYEISNFAKYGYHCQHNLKYWHCEEYLGFGISAHSYFNGMRFAFTPNIQKYINGVNSPESHIEITSQNEEISDRERIGEYIMLGLRLSEGIDIYDFQSRFGYSFENLYGNKFRRYVQGGYAVFRNGRYALTPKGMFVSNYILTDILEFEDLRGYSFDT